MHLPLRSSRGNRPLRGDQDLAAHVARELALQHEGALVLAGGGVWRYQAAGMESPLLDRERTAGELRRYLVDHVQGGKRHAFVRIDGNLVLSYGHHATSLEFVGGYVSRLSWTADIRS